MYVSAEVLAGLMFMFALGMVLLVLFIAAYLIGSKSDKQEGRDDRFLEDMRRKRSIRKQEENRVREEHLGYLKKSYERYFIDLVEVLTDKDNR